MTQTTATAQARLTIALTGSALGGGLGNPSASLAGSPGIRKLLLKARFRCYPVSCHEADASEMLSMMKTTPNDQAVNDLSFAEFKRICLLSKKIMRQSVIGVALSKCSKKGGNH